MHLAPLIIAVTCTARIRDLRDLSTGLGQGDCGGIDVAHSSDIWIDQHRSDGKDLHGALPVDFFPMVSLAEYACLLAPIW